MSKIIITDLFNNTKNISDSSEFILIHTNNIKNLLMQLDCNENSCIYGYNISNISNILKNSSLNMNNFRFLYHIHSINGTLPNYIVMANKSITKTIINYTIIDNYGKGFIWYPNPTDNFFSIGLVYTNTINQPSSKYFGLINENYIIKSDDKNVSDGLDNLCELSHNNIDKFIIFKNKFLYSTPHPKLNSTNKYVVHNINDNILKLKNKEYKNKHMMSYNPQGELITNFDFKNDSEESWTDNDDSFNSWSEYQEFPKSDVYVTQNSNSMEILKNNFQGKKVLLASSDNPWYNISDNNFMIPSRSDTCDYDNDSDSDNSTDSFHHSDVIENIVNNANESQYSGYNYMKIFNLLISMFIIILIIYLIYKNY